MDKLARDLATAVEYELILLDVQVPKQDGMVVLNSNGQEQREAL